MARLSLNGLQRHSRLAKPGETRVPQLMACEARYPRAPSCCNNDLLKPRSGQRLATVGSFQHEEEVIADGILRSLLDQIRVEVGKETRRYRDDTVFGALPFHDEQTSLADVDVPSAESERLRSPKATQKHGADHGAVTITAQRVGKGVDLVRRQHSRQSLRGAKNRRTAAGAAVAPSSTRE